MKPHIAGMVLVLLVSLVSPVTAAPDKGSLALLASYMQGDFNSSKQAKSTKGYFDISLGMTRIWAKKPGVWLYVEQAVSKKRARPYRQWVLPSATSQKGPVQRHDLQNHHRQTTAWTMEQSKGSAATSPCSSSSSQGMHDLPCIQKRCLQRLHEKERMPQQMGQSDLRNQYCDGDIKADGQLGSWLEQAGETGLGSAQGWLSFCEGSLKNRHISLASVIVVVSKRHGRESSFWTSQNPNVS